MGLLNWSESEDDDIKHGDREGQDEVQVEYKSLVPDLGTEPGPLKTKGVTKETLVCSCGSTRCFAIQYFGLPRPLFTSDIEPIPAQHIRDQRAETLKKTL